MLSWISEFPTTLLSSILILCLSFQNIYLRRDLNRLEGQLGDLQRVIERDRNLRQMLP